MIRRECINFLFIGPDKTGSTWLYSLLSRHPDVYVPTAKDLYYFDRYYHKGDEWYLSFFPKYEGQYVAIGELSHDYIFSQQAAKRIFSFNPNMKLLCTLRDPIDRTFSHYLNLKRNGHTKKPLRAAVLEYPELIDHSLYANHLSTYLELFGSQQLELLKFSNLLSSPKAFAQDVYRFLSLIDQEVLDLDIKRMPASRPRSYLLAKIAKKGANLIRDLGYPQMVGKVKYCKLAGLLYEPYAKDKKPWLSNDDILWLTDIFREDVYKVGKLFSLAAPEWTTHDY